ncbi:MAG TPA: hypothetical protein VLC09_00365, partial [Polyangiaceae bacterium]|nr:hypothetical protein [Polyangiaceae bacterium]
QRDQMATRTPFSFFVPLLGALAVAACGEVSTLDSGDVDQGEPDTGTPDSGGTGGGNTGSGGAVGTSGGAAGASTGGGSGGSSEPEPVLDADLVIDSSATHQRIDGFGAALPMWVGSAAGMLTSDEIHKWVGLGDDQLGLSIVRTIIEPARAKWAYAVANLKEAKSYGSDVSILASPWSPPAAMKSNNSTTGGGKLLTDYYDDYASHLNGYVGYMAGQGVTIDVVSVQNEPDWHPDYDSCDWTGSELLNFVKNNAPAIVGPRILIAESLQFTRSYTDPTLNDAVAVQNIDLVGGHLYGAEPAGKFTAYPLAREKGKPQWMTEWLTHEADGSGAAIWGGDNQAVWDETMDQVLRSVHRAMTIDWSAFIWWWGRRYYSFMGDGDANFGTTKGQILKRGWAFSHYAKFVRPGATRVDVEAGDTLSGLEITAYRRENETVVVLLNRTTTTYDEVIVEGPAKLLGVEAYATSRSQNRAATPVTETGRYATLASIAPRSIVTLVMSH